MRFFFRLPCFFQNLMCQDRSALFISAEPVRVHIGSLDQVVIEGGGSFHQRAADKGTSGAVCRHRKLSRRRFRVEFALRVDDHASGRPREDLVTAPQPGENFVVTAVDAISPKWNCKQESASTIFEGILLQNFHVFHDLGIDPVKRRPQNLVHTRPFFLRAAFLRI